MKKVFKALRKKGAEEKKNHPSQVPTLPRRIVQLDKLLLQLAVQLAVAVPSETGEEIVNALRLTGETMGIDYVAAVSIPRNREEAGIIHSYAAPGLSRSFMKCEEVIPWLMKLIKKGEIILLPRLPDDLPKEASLDRQYCRKEHIRSCLLIPCRVGQSISGGVVLGSFSSSHSWPVKLREQLNFLALILAGVLERRNLTEQIKELAEMRQFEELLSEISAIYINLPLEKIEAALKRDFERLGKALGVDMCILQMVGHHTDILPSRLRFFWRAFDNKNALKSADKWARNNPDLFNDLFRYLFDKWKKAEIMCWARLDEIPKEARGAKQFLEKFNIKAGLAVPLFFDGSVTGQLTITSCNDRTWPEAIIPRLKLFGEVFINALMRKETEEKLRTALSEIEQLKERIEMDYTYLREEVDLDHDFTDIIGKSAAMKETLRSVSQVASTDTTVLLLGETGTGKGLIARAIHNAGNRKDRPFVQVNCAALTPTLIESELFGHEKGAFTGAVTRRVGRFEIADGSTLFLDEIGELPPDLQVKLLRVLQDGEFERVGGTTTIRTNARIIAATNKDLQKEVEKGRFRKDLWYRLSTFPIVLPPLRARIDDIPLLVGYFVNKYSTLIGKEFSTISHKTFNKLQVYHWPGNIRELENTIERAVILSSRGTLQINTPIYEHRMTSGPQEALEEIEREHILKVLETTFWRISGPKGAAHRLRINPNTLRARMRKLGIRRSMQRA